MADIWHNTRITELHDELMNLFLWLQSSVTNHPKHCIIELDFPSLNVTEGSVSPANHRGCITYT